MLAVDTNVIVRYLVGDDADQAAQAKAVIDIEDVFVASTVLLETEWVLRGVYSYPAPAVARALRAFGGLPKVTIEDADLAAQALDWLEQGMDFADALHLAKAAGCSAFATFDRRLLRAAKGRSPVPVRLP